MDTREFLHFLYGDVTDGLFQLTYRHPVREHLFTHNFTLPINFLASDPALPELMRYNRDGYGIHFRLPVLRADYEGRGRGTELDSTLITALWADLDKDASVDARHRLMNTEPYPSVVVFSGGGYHAYWRLVEPVSIDASIAPMIKRTLKGIARTLKADEQVTNLAFMLRLPGTINTKPERNGAQCYVTDDCDGMLPQYHYHELEAEFAPRGRDIERPRVKRELPLSQERRVPDKVQGYLATGATEGERNRTLFVNACRLYTAGFSPSDVESLLTNRAASDGLSNREIFITLRSATRKAGGPSSPLPKHYRALLAGEDSRE